MSDDIAPQFVELGDKEHKELLTLFNFLNQDIERTKQRQWTVTYAVLLALGAVVGFQVSKGEAVGSSLRVSIVTLSVLLLVAGLANVMWAQSNLSRLRKLDVLYKSKLSQFAQALLRDDRADDPPRWVDPVGLSIAIIAAGIFSLVVSCASH